jgi:hypothetical protein
VWGLTAQAKDMVQDKVEEKDKEKEIKSSE